MTDLRCSHCHKPPNHEGAVPYHTLCSCGEAWFVPAGTSKTARVVGWDDAGDVGDRDGGLGSGRWMKREMP